MARVLVLSAARAVRGRLFFPLDKHVAESADAGERGDRNTPVTEEVLMWIIKILEYLLLSHERSSHVTDQVYWSLSKILEYFSLSHWYFCPKVLI